MAQAPQTAASPPDSTGPVRLKARVQEGYQVLRTLLERSGRVEVADRLAVWPSVDDVMTQAPELVPGLLAVAWDMRQDAAFAPLFAAQGGSGVAETQDDPIAPCGRSFRQILQSHLFATMRLNVDRAERDWAAQEARRARARWRKEQEDAPRGLLKGLLSKPKEPSFDPESFRPRFPGHGLYDAIKPYLTRPEQFGLIRAYTQLRTAQVQVLGDLLPLFTRPDQIAFLAGLTEGDISSLRISARIYGEWSLGYRKRKRKRNAEPAPLTDEEKAALAEEESRVFRILMAKHHGAVETLRGMGPNSEKVINLLAPVFGDDMWEIMDDPAAMANVINTPEHLIPILQNMSRYVTPDLSRALLQVNDQEIVKDLLAFACETFKDNELAFYLSDPSRLPIWDSLPAKFNNNFKYQRDAMKSSMVRNEEDLRTVASGIFNSLRQGRLM